MNSSLTATEGFDVVHFIEFQELQPLHCSKDALTDGFGWILQGLLAAIAFSCLIGELSNRIIRLISSNLTFIINSKKVL